MTTNTSTLSPSRATLGQIAVMGVAADLILTADHRLENLIYTLD